MRTSTIEQATDRLLRGHRAIRTLSPPDAPWPGTLMRLPDESSCVLVDADMLGTAWRGWDAAPAGHLLAPLDVVRRAAGHDVMLPVCAERVTVFLRRRDAAGTPLGSGEQVTLAVSVLRGLAALRRHRAAPAGDGEWWLTDTGRPVLATETGGDAVEESTMLLHQMRSSASTRGALARALDDAVAAVSDPHALARDLEVLEEALFDAAPASALGVDALMPQRARRLSAVPEPEIEEAAPVRRARWADLIATHVDGDIADATSQAVNRVWKRLRRTRPEGSRRRPWLLAGGLAASVLSIGLLWPTGGGPATADPAPSPAPAPSEAAAMDSPDTTAASGGTDQTAADEAAPAARSAPSADQDWATAAAQVLALRRGCGADAACLADVVEDPSRPLPAGVIDRAAAEQRISLLDEFGAVAVLRVDPLDGVGASQLVVLARTDENCLLRDVHDVAEQAG
jgi:hypothetical protein